MRAVIVSLFALAGTPALAQELYCEGTAASEAGEFVAGYNLAPDGTRKSSLFSWLPPRDKYESFDAEFMSSPRVMLHYRMNEDRLAGPAAIDIVTTQVHVPRTGGASPLALVEVEAVVAPSGSKVSWKASERAKGQPKLTELLRKENPTRLTIKLRERNKVTASAEFDLTKRASIDAMAVTARAEADRLVEKTKQMIAAGRKLRDCPY